MWKKRLRAGSEDGIDERVDFWGLGPQSSRERFKAREIQNYLTIAVIFIGVVFAASAGASAWSKGGFFPYLVIDGLALLVALFLYVIWHKRPIRIKCDSCKDIILSSTPWVCGVCKHQNRNAVEFPFVHKCGNAQCGAEPTAYKCHHKDCGELIFLTADLNQTNYAYCLNSPREVPAPDPHIENQKKRQQSKEEKDAELSLALVEEQLALVRKKIDKASQKPKTPKEKLSHGVAESMGLEQAYAELRAEFEKTYADDPATLKRMLKALKAEFGKRTEDGQ